MPPRQERIHRCPGYECGRLYAATFSDQIYCTPACGARTRRHRAPNGGDPHASAAVQRAINPDSTLGVGGMLTVRDGKTAWLPATAALPDDESSGLHKYHNQEAPRLVFGEAIPIKDAPSPATLRALGVPIGEAPGPPPHNDQGCESRDSSMLPTASSRENQKATTLVSPPDTKLVSQPAPSRKSSGQHMVWRPYGGKMLPEQEEMLKGHFLRAYEVTGCRKLNACRQVHVEPRTVDKWQEADPDFALRMMELHLGLLEELRAVNIEAARNPEKGFLSRITELKRLDPSYRERQWEIPVSGPVQINIVYKAQELPQGAIVDAEVKELPSG